jgi:adenylate cyclase
MGDTVNLASRLETVNKIYGTAILMSEDTQRQTGDAFMTREIDRIRVKGRAAPVAVFELIGRRGEEDPPWLRCFASGLEAYRCRDWDLADSHFERTLLLRPDDPPSQVYRFRCRHFREKPPAEDWDGVFVQTSK